MLYSSAQNEIEALKEKVAMLEKKLASSRSAKNGNIVGSAMYQAIIDNQTSIYTADEHKDKDDVIMNVSRMLNIYNLLTTSSNSICIRTDNQQFTTSSDRNLPSYPVTVTSVQLNQLKENDMSLSVQLGSKRKSTTSTIGSSDEIIQDSDLFCEPNSIASMDKYIFDKKTGERWIASPTSLYSFVSGSSRNRSTFPSSQDTESQWQTPFFEAPTNIATTTRRHPLNLGWILTQNEE
jgi:hypothetical protein